MFENFSEYLMLIKPWIVDSTWQALIVQYSFVVITGLFHVYQILGMRRDSVVVISYSRIWFGVFFTAAFGLAFYRLAIWLNPRNVDWWKSALYFVGVYIAFIILKSLLYMLVSPFVDKERALIDTEKSEADLFNCNWPLIPRCSHQGLSYLLLFGLMLVNYS